MLKLIEGVPMKLSADDWIALLVQFEYELATNQCRECTECQIDK